MGKYISILFFAGILFTTPQFVGAVVNTEETTKMICVSGFVESREQIIIQAQEIFQSKIKSAIESRRGALIPAWKEIDRVKRTAALKKIWGNFNVTVKAARVEHKAMTKGAWSIFATNIKTHCGFTGVSGETPAGDTSRY